MQSQLPAGLRTCQMPEVMPRALRPVYVAYCILLTGRTDGQVKSRAHGRVRITPAECHAQWYVAHGDELTFSRAIDRHATSLVPENWHVATSVLLVCLSG
jgi:hypothetical protein